MAEQKWCQEIRGKRSAGYLCQKKRLTRSNFKIRIALFLMLKDAGKIAALPENVDEIPIIETVLYIYRFT